MRILLVDDEKFQLGLSERILKVCGFDDIVLAADGQEALECILTSTTDFDLILCDYHMPKLDGFQLLEKLNDDGYTSKFIFLSGSTSNIDLEFYLETLEAGNIEYLGYLSKPLKPSDLSQLLNSKK